MTAFTIPIKVLDALTGDNNCSLVIEGTTKLVQDLKAKLQDILSIPSVEQRLFVQGQLLTNDCAPLLAVLDENHVVYLLHADNRTIECSLAAPVSPILGMIVCAELGRSLLVRSDRRKGLLETFISDTAIGQWNSSHEFDEQVILGDSIIMVNNVGADAKAMLKELRTADSLELLLKPGATRRRSSGMLDMKRASFQNKKGDIAL